MSSLVGHLGTQLYATHPLVRHLALALRLVPSGEDYRKFIILGRSRTGSNFLRGLMGSREGTFVLGEVFKNPEKIEWGTKDFPSWLGAGYTYRRDPVAFLEEYIYRPLPSSIQALGFKLFYYHSHEPGREALWEHLQQRKDLYVLHIIRRNILQTHLSRALAARSGQWVSVVEESQREEPIFLPIEECRTQFELTRKWENEFKDFFSKSRVMEVYYEDLAADYVQVMNKVQRFLGLPIQPVAPLTFRQSHRPMREIIANFDQLRQAFRGTEWEGFFEQS